MSERVKTLAAVKSEPVGEVVDELRRLLESAERGEIRGFVIGYTSNDPNSLGLTAWRAATTRDKMLLIAAYTLAAQDLIASVHSGMEDA